MHPISERCRRAGRLVATVAVLSLLAGPAITHAHGAVAVPPVVRPAAGLDAVVGIGGDTCTVTDSAGRWQFCDYQSGPWTALKAARDVQYARMVVPWDAFQTWNTTTQACVANTTTGTAAGSYYETDDSGGSWAGALEAFATAARNDGVVPLIGLGNGNGQGRASSATEPRYPNPRTGPTTSPSTGDQMYSCGFEGITATLAQVIGEASPIETYNEPDNDPNVGTLTSPERAARFYLDARAAEQALGARNPLIAGAMNYATVDHNCCGWMDAFLTDLKAGVQSFGEPLPAAISGHPYNDPTRSGACACLSDAGTMNLVTQVNQELAAGEPIWLTEVGVWLDDPASDGAGATLGRDVDGNPLAQAYGAQGFADLAALSPQVQAVFYYEFETYGDGLDVGGDSFDSALLGISSAAWGSAGQDGAYDPAAGAYGVPRASLCVLAYGDTPQTAVTDSRCDFTRSPETPWTSWQSPNSGNGGWVTAVARAGDQALTVCAVGVAGPATCTPSTSAAAAAGTVAIAPVADAGAGTAAGDASAFVVRGDGHLGECLSSTFSVSGCWDSGQAVSPGTSPSVATIAGGTAIAAFRSASGALGTCTLTASGPVNCTIQSQTLAAGASPGVAALGNGDAVVALANAAGQLTECQVAASGASTCWSTPAAIAPGTTPAVAEISDGTSIAAVHAASGPLQTCHFTATGPGSCTGTKTMLAGASPAIVALSDGDAAVAFDYFSNQLAECHAAASGASTCWNSAASMASGPAPGLAELSGGTSLAGFRTSSGALETCQLTATGPAHCTVQTQTLLAGASPGVTGLNNGTAAVALAGASDQLRECQVQSTGGATCWADPVTLASPSALKLSTIP